MKLSECFGIRDHITCESPYLTIQEILCDRIAGGDEEKYRKGVIPWIIRNAFGLEFSSSH